MYYAPVNHQSYLKVMIKLLILTCSLIISFNKPSWWTCAYYILVTNLIVVEN